MRVALRPYLPILLLTFVNVIGFTLLIPVLPDVVDQYVSREWSGMVYGALISSYAAFQFLAAPFLGAYSDRFGRKPLLIVSQLGTTLSWVLMAATWFLPDISILGISLPLLMIALSRVTDGITGGNISVAEAWIADKTPKKQRTAVFGILGAVFGIGFLLGPVIGGFLSSFSIGYLGAVLFALALSLITLAYIWYGLPESLPPERRSVKADIFWMDKFNIFRQIKQFAGNKLVIDLLVLRVFFALVFSSYTTLTVLLFQREFRMGAAGIGLMMSILAVFSIINQAFFAARVVGKIGEIRAIYMSYGALFVGLICLAALPVQLWHGAVNMSIGLFLASACLLMFGVSIAMPTFKSALTSAVTETQQGGITGLDASLLSLGQAVSPVISASLYGFMGHQTFAVYAMVLLLPIGIIWLREGHPILRDKRS